MTAAGDPLQIGFNQQPDFLFCAIRSHAAIAWLENIVHKPKKEKDTRSTSPSRIVGLEDSC